MCYSAQVWGDYRKYVRAFGADIDISAFVRLYVERAEGAKHKIPKGMDAPFLGADGGEEGLIAEAIAQWMADQVSSMEQEVFKQAKRLASAERTLKDKTTKKALDDQRIATSKIEQLKGRLSTLKRTEFKDADSRIFPGMFAPVMVTEEGRRVVRPMRYQCRPCGKPAFYDRKFPGTYNARRDSLEKFWREQFGATHALMIAQRFYENVETPEGNAVLEFVPRTGEPMLIACLYSHWVDPEGKEPDLWSYAAITDEPEAEVAAAGHDRTIINLKPDHIDAWLNPDPGNLDALYGLFDDKQHPFYEHRKAA